MAAPAQHIERAKRNQQFAEHLDLGTTEFRDWIVVGYFYSALHWIDAYLVSINRPPGDNHGSRNTLTNTERELTPISRPYRLLYSYSRNVRYDLIDFSADRIRQDVIPKIHTVRSHLEQLLKDRGIVV